MKPTQKHKKRAEELKAKSQQLAEKAAELKKQATQMAEAEQLQQQIRERIGNRKEGLRAEVEKLRATLKQNGLEKSNAMERMTAVGRELDRLAERELENIEPKLTNARKMADLLDEKTRQERQAELEKRAKQAESEAKAAEALAKKLNEQADRAEKAADAADGEQEKAASRKRPAGCGSRFRSNGSGPSERAAAGRARSAATPARSPIPPAAAGSWRRRVADRKRWRRASIRCCCETLGPWASTAEIKGEAGRILQEQKELQAQLEALDKKGLTGKSPEELDPQQKADLENLQDTQRRLQERTAGLLNKMKRVAEMRGDKDPETAKELKEAAEKAEEGNLAGQMKEAGDSIKQNKLNEAKQKQRRAVAELEKLVKNLEDRREERELDRIRKKMREAEKMVRKLLRTSRRSCARRSERQARLAIRSKTPGRAGTIGSATEETARGNRKGARTTVAAGQRTGQARALAVGPARRWRGSSGNWNCPASGKAGQRETGGRARPAGGGAAGAGASAQEGRRGAGPRATGAGGRRDQSRIRKDGVRKGTSWSRSCIQDRLLESSAWSRKLLGEASATWVEGVKRDWAEETAARGEEGPFRRLPSSPDCWSRSARAMDQAGKRFEEMREMRWFARSRNWRRCPIPRPATCRGWL